MRLLLACLLLAGCSGQPNPDAMGALADQRAAELRGISGRRLLAFREGRKVPLAIYDVEDLLCFEVSDFPKPETSLSPGVLTFHDGDDDCMRLDPDKLVELAEKLSEENDGYATFDAGVLVVRKSWTSQTKVAAFLERLASQPCRCHARQALPHDGS